MTRPKASAEKRATKKLAVKKETVRDLAPKDFTKVKGGARRAGGTEFLYDQAIKR
jgi:hypothetical protein